MKKNRPTKIEVYRAAKSYVASGLSLIPIRADGQKTPAFELLPEMWCAAEGKYKRPWGGYRSCRPTPAEIQTWFRDSFDDYGVAVIAGAISGNLEIIDLDNWQVAMAWTKLLRKRSPGLLKRLVRVKSPRPGLHVYYRCETIAGNQKLARIPDPEHGGKKPKTIIETKGEGGYVLAPPSPAKCHPTGRCYAFLCGKDLTRVQTITPEEREVLLDCARVLNRWIDTRRGEYRRKAPVTGTRPARPGDDFNLRADWADVLEPHGWKWAGSSGGVNHWRRPGKGSGTSATTNYAGSDLLYVFSSNADFFESEKGYSKFSAYALLNHGGDFRAAAAALARKGYGAKRSAKRNLNAPFRRYANYDQQQAAAAAARRIGSTFDRYKSYANCPSDVGAGNSTQRRMLRR